MKSISLFDARKSRGIFNGQFSLLRRSTCYVLRLAIVGVALVLSGCGGNSDGPDIIVIPPADAEQAPLIPVAGDGADGTPVLDEPLDTPPTSTPSTSTDGLNIAPADVAGGSYYQDSRVSGLSTGPVFGTGERPNSELVKPIPVQIVDVEASLRLLELRVLRRSGMDSNGVPESTAAYLGIVQNASSQFLCII
ncbi:MAG: hypothetical protein AB8B97_09625 [Granulosicoccus sp.]